MSDGTRGRQTRIGVTAAIGGGAVFQGLTAILGLAAENPASGTPTPELQPANPLIPPPALVVPPPTAPTAGTSALPTQSAGGGAAPSETREESRRRFDELQIPIYQRVRPEWATELSYSMRGLGSATQLAAAPTSTRLPAVSLRFEYQPSFLQSLGVIGIGPSFQYFSLPADVAASGLGCYSVGGQARYQLRLLREQWVVPYAGYSFERLAYRLKDGTKSSFVSKGAFFGASLLLNIFEPSVAADAYAGTGIVRTYLLAELRSLSEGDAQIPVSGRSLFFGLRFEY